MRCRGQGTINQFKYFQFSNKEKHFKGLRDGTIKLMFNMDTKQNRDDWVKVIYWCTSPEPENRPDAFQVKDRLATIMENPEVRESSRVGTVADIGIEYSGMASYDQVAYGDIGMDSEGLFELDEDYAEIAHVFPPSDSGRDVNNLEVLGPETLNAAETDVYRQLPQGHYPGEDEAESKHSYDVAARLRLPRHTGG
eukprot:TRINITY_DN1036_c0_g1_i2.p1 TRINITY_DN1036_c0_g1~~TRINITY_DN1036_c0_g1_i2.p1  ORF type:complete len:195 (+),score=23.19 TRINITY_DN1036_c0_g1_i2:201-785(+)